jgi:hypothetical protein
VSGIEVIAEGESIIVAPEVSAALEVTAPVDQLTSRTIHAHFTARIAAELGAALTFVEVEPKRALLRAAVG